MIAEICIRHAKICITKLLHKTTLQNSLENKQLLPLIIGVKRASDLFKRVRFEFVAKVSRFVNYSIVTDYSLILSPLKGSNGRLNAFLV